VKLIDTHIHLDLIETPEIMLAEARKVNVGAWIVPGVSPGHWAELMATVEKLEGLFAAPGIHPQEAHKFERHQIETLAELLADPKAVAIGEVGLDRQVACPMETQEDVFIRMIHLARETNKPLLIHSRRTTERILELLKTEGGGKISGIFHAFSGSLETAGKIVDMGFALGIGGVVTYTSAKRLPQVVREMPADSIVLETDAPDITPEPYRGQENRPAWLGLVAERVAYLRNWTAEETARITSTNAARILSLPKDIFYETT